MKLTIETKALSGALGVVGALAASRTTQPMLGCVHIRAEGNRLTLATTNLDIGMELHLPVEVETPGAAVVPATKLTKAVARISAETVGLYQSKNALEVTSDDHWLKLFSFAPEDFPPMPAAPEGTKLAAPEHLGSVLTSALAFVSTDETRYVLNGVCFASEEGGDLACVGTDGRRLFRAPIEVAEPWKTSAIVPTEAVKLLAKLLGAGEVGLDFGESQMVATGPSWRLATKLIEGNYPQYREVVPATGRHKFTVSREALLGALPFVEVMTSDKSAAVKVSVEKNQLVLTTQVPEVGESRVSVAATTAGGALTAAFNARLLAEVVNAMPGAEISLDSDGETSPLKVESSGFVAVLMPMRIA